MSMPPPEGLLSRLSRKQGRLTASGGQVVEGLPHLPLSSLAIEEESLIRQSWSSAFFEEL